MDLCKIVKETSLSIFLKLIDISCFRMAVIFPVTNTLELRYNPTTVNSSAIIFYSLFSISEEKLLLIG